MIFPSILSIKNNLNVLFMISLDLSFMQGVRARMVDKDFAPKVSIVQESMYIHKFSNTHFFSWK